MYASIRASGLVAFVTFTTTTARPVLAVDLDNNGIQDEDEQESAGEGPVAARMQGVFDRTFDPAIARIYHNRLEQNFPNSHGANLLLYSRRDGP